MLPPPWGSKAPDTSASPSSSAQRAAGLPEGCSSASDCFLHCASPVQEIAAFAPRCPLGPGGGQAGALQWPQERDKKRPAALPTPAPSSASPRCCLLSYPDTKRDSLKRFLDWVTVH